MREARSAHGDGPQRVGAWLFVGLAALYVGTAHGRPFSDSVHHFEQIDTFVSTGAFTMAPGRRGVAPESAAFLRTGRDGRVYSTLPPGLALAGSPLGWIGAQCRRGRGTGDGAERAPRPGSPDPSVTRWASFTMPLALAGMVTAWFAICRHASRSPRRAAAGALVLGVATNTWFYATTFWTRPLAAACLVGALAVIIDARDRPRSWLAAGALLGFAVVTRYEVVLVVPWLVGLALVEARRRGVALAALLAPLCAAAAGLALWNDFRFGSWLETGAAHQGAHFFRLRYADQQAIRLLFGENEGLFRYVPILLLGLLAIPSAWRAQRRLVVAVLGAAVTLVVFYAVFTESRSVPPIAWGSRHLFSVVPLLLLLAFVTSERDPLASWPARILLAVSVPLQLWGVLQRSRVAPPIWWLAEPSASAVATALALGALAVYAAHRLLRELDRRA